MVKMGKGSIGYFLVLIYVDFLNFVLQSTFGHSEKGGDNLWATAKLRSSPSRMSTFGDFTGAPDQTKLFGPKFCQSFKQTRKEIVLSDSSIEPFKIWIFSACGYLEKRGDNFWALAKLKLSPGQMAIFGDYTVTTDQILFGPKFANCSSKDWKNSIICHESPFNIQILKAL